MSWLFRPILIPALHFTNRVWIKKTRPDWQLLIKYELSQVFPDSTVFEERKALGVLTYKGKHRSQKILNALILFGCDEREFQKKRSTNKETEVSHKSLMLPCEAACPQEN